MKDIIKRINFEVPGKVHKKLKMIALKRNITLKELISRALAKLIIEEKKYN